MSVLSEVVQWLALPRPLVMKTALTRRFPSNRLTASSLIRISSGCEALMWMTGWNYTGRFIAHTRFRLQVNRELSVRLVVQYDDSKYNFYGMGSNGPQYFRGADKAWDVDPLITYRLSSFTVLHAGSTHDYSYFPEDNDYSSKWKLSSRQFFVKLQYLFQV